MFNGFDWLCCSVIKKFDSMIFQSNKAIACAIRFNLVEYFYFRVVFSSLVCVCVCVCVCVSVYNLSSVCKMSDTCLRGTDQRCCVVSILRCASAKFLHLNN